MSKAKSDFDAIFSLKLVNKVYVGYGTHVLKHIKILIKFVHQFKLLNVSVYNKINTLNIWAH